VSEWMCDDAKVYEAKSSRIALRISTPEHNERILSLLVLKTCGYKSSSAAKVYGCVLKQTCQCLAIAIHNAEEYSKRRKMIATSMALRYPTFFLRENSFLCAAQAVHDNTDSDMNVKSIAKLIIRIKHSIMEIMSMGVGARVFGHV